MLETLVKPRADIITITSNTTLQEAFDILEAENLRALPILDADGQMFRGVIYKLHLYKHLSEQADMSQPVTTLMRNMTKFINIDASFFDLIFALRDLPFISVLDDRHHFIGIITNNRLNEVFENSWTPSSGRYVMTILTDGERGSLEKISKIIARYTDILSLVTFDPDENIRTTRVVVTLPMAVDEARLSKIIRQLSRRGFHLESLENL
ncbi:cyclic di-AMP binding protein CbpA [Weissella ceti]|uniref:Cyclic di-AMP binding protein CbpA n=1 Tax=Weissella ceti TaxID=759620 RepID=A0ABT3E595_9LACO|nr:cyclic di-AMP binding protein CbpA [Weissella ceti]MCW0953545.1 cyclic di-AMP binding protein CbpA [Weissella ceti]QVK12307.1 CBS domain-containing protein [Weissella ceti]